MQVFMVCVTKQPTEKQKFDEGATPVIVVQPVAVMASDIKQASMKAFRFVPEEFQEMQDLLEVHVMPFQPAR